MDTLQKFRRELERLPKGNRRRVTSQLKALAIFHADSVIRRAEPKPKPRENLA
ncbi:MAG: hypothetical protein AAFY60_03325 [Myxococcota bacterium]